MKDIYVGNEHCSGMNQSQPMKNYSGEESCVTLSMPSFNRQEQKRKAVKDKVQICISIISLTTYLSNAHNWAVGLVEDLG